MTYYFKTNIPKDEFDYFVHHSKQNSLFQESNWALVKDNWQSFLTGIYKDDHLVGTGLVLSRHLIGPYHLFYLPRGPILNVENEEEINFYFQELKKLAKAKKAIAIRFDPYLVSRHYPFEKRNEKPQRQYVNYINLLKKIGINHKGYTTLMAESTQPRFNACKYVKEGYFAELDYRTKKYIRLAKEKGIEIREGKSYSKELAMSMHYTEIRKKIALRNEEYFHHMIDVYDKNIISLIAIIDFPKQINYLNKEINLLKEQKKQVTLSAKQLAKINQDLEKLENNLSQIMMLHAKEGHDQVVTCGLLGAYNNGVMELFYMGNNPDYLKFYSSYLLYNTAIQRCVDLHIPYCSFGGIEGTLDDGLTIFKSKWKMEVEELIGEFNYILKPMLYYAFDQLFPKIRAFIAKKRGHSR